MKVLHKNSLRKGEPNKWMAEDIIETIRAEVERQAKSINTATGDFAEGRRMEQRIILSILDTLQEKSEKPINPVCEELDYKNWDDLLTEEMPKVYETYTRPSYIEENSTQASCHFDNYIARHFYELGRQSKPKVSEDLEKYASQAGFDYVDDIVLQAEPNHRWNDHDVENAHRDGIIKGASWQKEQMIKEAVESGMTVGDINRKLWEVQEDYKVFFCKDNDKVRIVIVKEEGK